MTFFINVFATRKTGVTYSFKISPRLGDGSYKEQKAYLYRNSLKDNDGSRKILVENDYVYNDLKNVYDRPPYVAHFSLINSELTVTELTMINLHLTTTSVYNESLALREVVDEIKFDYNENIIIMGDLNFDCRYISGARRELVRQKLAEFTFYISDDVSTTTSNALCALDRILISGDSLKNSVIKGSNSTYLYYKDFGMTIEEVF